MDKNGERTLPVVPVIDEFTKGLMDDVNIGLDCVYVRKSVGDESYEEARPGREKPSCLRHILS